MPRFPILLVSRTRARFAGLWLDKRLAAGEDPFEESALAWRSAELVTKRSRRLIVNGLQRVLSSRTPTGATAAVRCDWQAIAIARPALQQLAEALRSRASVQPQGLAIVQVLLTDLSSPLYEPAYPSELYEVARKALFALGPDNDIHGAVAQPDAIS